MEPSFESTDMDAPLDMHPRPKYRLQRMLVSLTTLAFGFYVLVDLYPDFRFWLEPSAPQELGLVRDVLQDGRLPEHLEHRHVAFEATPDIRFPIRLSTKDQSEFVRYFRLNESDGALFSSHVIAGADTENNYPERFEGRVRRLSDNAAFGWIRDYFAMREAVRPVEVEPSEVAKLNPETRVRIVEKTHEQELHFDAARFTSEDSVMHALAATVFKYRWDSPKQTKGDYPAWKIILEAVEDKAVQAALPEMRKLAPEGTTAKLVDIAWLPRQTIWLTSAGEFRDLGEKVEFRAKTADVAEEVERAVRKADLLGIRAELPIRVDPDAALIECGVSPKDLRLEALGWAVVLLIVMANFVAFVRMATAWRKSW